MKKRGRHTSHFNRNKDNPSKKHGHTTGHSKDLTKKNEAAQRAPSLHGAAGLRSHEIQQMLDQGADVNETRGGQTPLYRFIEARNLDGIVMLLLYGASVTHKDNYGETPLHNAGRNNSHLATLLITSPQGNPTKITDEMRNWCNGNAYSYWMMRKQFGIPRDICLLICKFMIPSLKKLVAMIPFNKLPAYLDRYSAEEKKVVLDALVKRHIADLCFNLGVKNNRNRTPQGEAILYGNSMLPFAPPISTFNKDLISQHKPTITANYAKLLGIQQ